MKILRLVLVFLIACTSGLALAAIESNDVHVAVSQIHYRNFIIETALTLSVAAKSPQWRPEATSPPLLPEEAKRIALAFARRSELQKFALLGGQLRVAQTALVNVPDTPVWFYAFDVYFESPGTGGRKTFKVYVTMDGTAAPIHLRENSGRGD